MKSPGCGRCRSSSGEGRQGSSRATFKSIIKTDPADLPGVDAKPEYHTVLATVAQIDPDINLYYNACPENNRKVRFQYSLSRICRADNGAHHLEMFLRHLLDGWHRACWQCRALLESEGRCMGTHLTGVSDAMPWVR